MPKEKRILSLFFIFFLFSIFFFLFNINPANSQTSLTVSMTVDDTTLLISGKTSPEALVTFTENNSVLGTTSALSDGTFSQRFTAQTAGLHQIKIYAKDSAGVTSSTVTQSLSLTGQTETSLSNVILPPTISLDKSTAAQGETVTVSGRTAPAATVAIFVFETRIANVTSSSATGAWTYSLDTSQIALGDQSIYVKTTTAEGYQSQTSQTLTFTLNAPTTTPTTTPATPPSPTSALTKVIPQIIARFFDPDGSGRIEVQEVFVAVKAWVEEWRQVVQEEIKALAEGKTLSPEEERKCDLNTDHRCNLLDFSVLLYYIER